MPDFVGFSSEQLAELTGVDHSWILHEAGRAGYPSPPRRIGRVVHRR